MISKCTHYPDVFHILIGLESAIYLDTKSQDTPMFGFGKKRALKKLQTVALKRLRSQLKARLFR